MTDSEVIRKVQTQLNGMKAEELGAALSQSDVLRRHGATRMERAVGTIMYQQVLAAFTYKEAEKGGKIQ